MNIKHETDKWLVIWAPTPLLIEGSEGQYTGTIHEHDWFDTRDAAITAIRNLHPEWVAPPVEDPEQLN